jgi:hypothetical protein
MTLLRFSICHEYRRRRRSAVEQAQDRLDWATARTAATDGTLKT